MGEAVLLFSDSVELLAQLMQMCANSARMAQDRAGRVADAYEEHAQSQVRARALLAEVLVVSAMADCFDASRVFLSLAGVGRTRTGTTLKPCGCVCWLGFRTFQVANSSYSSKVYHIL